jgi:hypothetical protein
MSMLATHPFDKQNGQACRAIYVAQEIIMLVKLPKQCGADSKQQYLLKAYTLVRFQSTIFN